MIMYVAGSGITTQDRNHPEGGGTETSSGAVDEGAFQEFTTETETVRAAIRSPGGLARLAEGDRRHVDLTVVMVVTDRRIRFLPGADGTLGSPEDAGAIAYHEIAGVSVARTVEPEGGSNGERDGDGYRAEPDPDRGDGHGGVPGGRVLEFASTDGVRWRVPLPAPRPDADGTAETVDAAVRHLRWIGEVRSRIVAARNDVDLAAGEIDDYATAMDWDRAERVYRDARAAIDRVADAVFRTGPVAAHHLAPELTSIERRLESAYAALFIERASSQLTLGQQLVENGDYDQARTVIERSRSLYGVALDHAAAVRRGDAFVFGEQRELDDDLDRLAWEIEAVAAEPIRQAHEAKILARNADGPDEAIDHWERAYRLYANVSDLEPDGEGRTFAGDSEAVRAEMAEAAERLVALHRDRTRDQWNAGISRHESGAVEAALRRYTVAQEHLSRAHELAAEFDRAAASTIGDQLQQIVDSLTRVRQTASVDAEESRERFAEAGGGTAGRDRGPEGFGQPPAGAGDPTSGNHRHPAAERRATDTATEVRLRDDGTAFGATPEETAPRTCDDRTRNGSGGDLDRAASGEADESDDDVVVHGDRSASE
jgi:tetratricopeptide (TPR) repeat protein